MTYCKSCTKQAIVLAGQTTVAHTWRCATTCFRRGAHTHVPHPAAQATEQRYSVGMPHSCEQSLCTPVTLQVRKHECCSCLGQEHTQHEAHLQLLFQRQRRRMPGLMLGQVGRRAWRRRHLQAVSLLPVLRLCRRLCPALWCAGQLPCRWPPAGRVPAARRTRHLMPHSYLRHAACGAARLTAAAAGPPPQP